MVENAVSWKEKHSIATKFLRLLTPDERAEAERIAAGLRSSDEYGWLHAIAVVMVDGVEASSYLGVQVRFSGVNFQMRSNASIFFKITRAGHARLSFMDGDFMHVLSIDIGPVHAGNKLEVRQ